MGGEIERRDYEVAVNGGGKREETIREKGIARARKEGVGEGREKMKNGDREQYMNIKTVHIALTAVLFEEEKSKKKK